MKKVCVAWWLGHTSNKVEKEYQVSRKNNDYRDVASHIALQFKCLQMHVALSDGETTRIGDIHIWLNNYQL